MIKSNYLLNSYKLTRLLQCNEGETCDTTAECAGGLQTLERLSQVHSLSLAANSH